MFGKGIYFADMSSKSANYCFPQKDKPGIMILAEVALGNPRTLFREDYDADKLDDGKNSTIGLGKIGPDPAKDEATLVSSSLQNFATIASPSHKYPKTISQMEKTFNF